MPKLQSAVLRYGTSMIQKDVANKGNKETRTKNGWLVVALLMVMSMVTNTRLTVLNKNSVKLPSSYNWYEKSFYEYDMRRIPTEILWSTESACNTCIQIRE
jgi:hypothetical protein